VWTGSKPSPPPQVATAAAPSPKAARERNVLSARKPAPDATPARRRSGKIAARARDAARERHDRARDFDNAKFNYNGIASTFFRRDGKFFVNTDGVDGKLADFEISYTFGLYPCAAVSRRVCRTGACRRCRSPGIRDRRRRVARAGTLVSGRARHIDRSLHWTGLNQNWNWMCADCHSTKLDRNYEAANTRMRPSGRRSTLPAKPAMARVRSMLLGGPKRGQSQFPARRLTCRPPWIARKLTLAPFLPVALDERKGVTWLAKNGYGQRGPQHAADFEARARFCAQCHSRRAPFAAGMDHDGRFFETHEVSLLTDRLYFAVGQQRDEV
jgi:hypothetical protein